MLFRCIADGSGEWDRLSHNLRERLDRHVFPLSSQDRTDTEGNREIRPVTDGGISTCYLCFTYMPVSTISLVF